MPGQPKKREAFKRLDELGIDLVAELVASGLSAKKLCEVEGLSSTYFFYGWIRSAGIEGSWTKPGSFEPRCWPRAQSRSLMKSSLAAVQYPRPNSRSTLGSGWRPAWNRSDSARERAA